MRSVLTALAQRKKYVGILVSWFHLSAKLSSGFAGFAMYHFPSGREKTLRLTNNPKGFRTWFDEKNAPFLAASRASYRECLFEENRALFSSVEEIPHELDRSALQRVIQILKYHRDVYYAKFKDGDELKPISAIINVVTTQIASQHDPNCSVFELLEYILGELNIYAQQEKLTFREFEQIYGNQRI